MKNTPRQTKREAQRKQQLLRRVFTIGGISLAVIALIVIIVLLVNKTPSPTGLMGEEVLIQSADHVSEEIQPGPYNSNPPAGGNHFEEDFPAKFYLETDLATLPKYPEGYLVHSLEHGYVIFWYNCQAPNTDCTTMKQTIQKVMDDTGGTKLIAFPWADMNIPLAMTTWGRILKFDKPDPVLMKQFVERNRYQAPEPNAP